MVLANWQCCDAVVDEMMLYVYIGAGRVSLGLAGVDGARAMAVAV